MPKLHSTRFSNATMSRTTTEAALSFKPWIRDTSNETALGEVLARVNLERGHFRDITEASLQEELAADGGLEADSSDEEDGENDEDAAKTIKRGAPASREDLYAAKHEMLSQAGAAHQEVMMALDFIALLESKHAQQAKVSISDEVKNKHSIPLGSLGTDVWDPKAKPVDKQREAEDNLLAVNVRMAGLQQSADDLLAAATRLQEHVRKETVFWDQILSVTDRGWSVSKMPRSHMLGVHYGFNGCARDFARRGVAALISDSDGGITLERGIGTKPKAVRAVIRKEGRVVGSSALPVLPRHGETTLEAQIRHARDSVYDEELFHEMIREARTLASMGVKMRGSAIGLPGDQDGALRIELELVSLDEDNSLGLDTTQDHGTFAKAILLAARLILGQEHRTKIEQKREIPPPMAEKKDDSDQQSLSILRPLLLLMKHYSQVTELNNCLDDMSKLLQKTQASIECHHAHLALASTTKGTTTVESVIESLRQPISSQGRLRLTAEGEAALELALEIETSLANSLGSSFILKILSGTETATFESLSDACEAADDFLALGLSRILKEVVGKGWKLDQREGIISRSDGEDGRELMWFDVTSADKVVALHVSGWKGKDQAIWKLDDSGESRGMKDVWSGLLE